MPKITIKPFQTLTPTELYTLLKLRQDIFIIEQTCIYPDLDDKDQTAHHLMAFDGEQMVGCLRILARGVSYEEASIGRVVTSKDRRGEGIAKEMMLQALGFIQSELGETRVRISAQAYATPFYESVGFAVVSEEYLEDDIPHVEMLCNLAKNS